MSGETFDLGTTFEFLIVKFLNFIPSLIAAMVIFVIGIVATILITRLIKITLERRNVDQEIIISISRVAYITLITMTLVMALQQVGFNLTAFLAGLGILGFTVGFALQDVSKNFIAGLLLLWQQPFNIGEMIEVSDYLGTVEEIDLRATCIRTVDGRFVFIPNADVYTKPLINYSKAERRRVEIPLSVSSDSDLELVKKVAVGAIMQVPGLLSDPAPSVEFHTFGDFALNLALYYWIDTSRTNISIARDAGINAVNAAFRAHEINLPFPTQTVHLMSN
jgi:small conductance mechanosensitive channel